MLKTRTAFFLAFSFFAFIFALFFYIFVNSHLNFLLFKQYEQKIKSINDLISFYSLNFINEDNIKALSKQSRADFIIIDKNGSVISSLQDYELYKNLEENKILNFHSKNILVKNFSKDGISYSIIVYPRFLNLSSFWFYVVCFYLIFLFFIFVLFFLFAKQVSKNINEMILFLDSIDSVKQISLKKSIFKDINILNAKLLKIKDKIIKRQQKNKKQSDKIALKNTQLSNVISAISHELKNPLSVIDLSVELLKKENDKILKDELLEKIQRQSFKLNNLTNKLNFVFNINKENLNIEKFDIFKLCEKILKNPGFERVVLNGQSSIVKADEFLIEQVLINLISNSLKYSQKDVVLTVSNQTVTVRDFGEGIKEDSIKLITKKFYKIDSKSNNSFGLGLFLVKKILSIHGSYLEISSLVGQGSTFSFKLKG